MFSIKYDSKTDVYGVYDRPPTEPDAILLKEIGKHLLYTWSSKWCNIFMIGYYQQHFQLLWQLLLRMEAGQL